LNCFMYAVINGCEFDKEDCLTAAIETHQNQLVLYIMSL
jgi:hypothetical protein